MIATEPSITDWISAISTAALGVFGALFTWWQWSRSGFRPLLTSRIDDKREAIEVRIANTGRSGGLVDRLEVLGPDDAFVDAEYDGFNNHVFRPLALPAMASMRIIITAPKGDTFKPGARLLVGLGADKPEIIVPNPAAPKFGLSGLSSILPPGSSN